MFQADYADAHGQRLFAFNVSYFTGFYCRLAKGCGQASFEQLVEFYQTYTWLSIIF
jgi:hypothetical protein